MNNIGLGPNESNGQVGVDDNGLGKPLTERKGLKKPSQRMESYIWDPGYGLSM